MARRDLLRIRSAFGVIRSSPDGPDIVAPPAPAPTGAPVASARMSCPRPKGKGESLAVSFRKLARDHKTVAMPRWRRRRHTAGERSLSRSIRQPWVIGHLHRHQRSPLAARTLTGRERARHARDRHGVARDRAPGRTLRPSAHLCARTCASNGWVQTLSPCSRAHRARARCIDRGRTAQGPRPQPGRSRPTGRRSSFASARSRGRSPRSYREPSRHRGWTARSASRRKG